MRPSKPNLLYNKIYKNNYQGRNISRNSSSSQKIIDVNNDKKINISNGINNYIHIKKLIFKKPPDLSALDLRQFKTYKAKRIKSSFDHLKKINNLFIFRLQNQWTRKSNDDVTLPKLSFNENTSISNIKSKSISYDIKNRINSNIFYNPSFPFIKNMNISENKRPKQILINNNNYKSFLKKKNLMNNINIYKNVGVNSINLSFKIDTQKSSSFFKKCINNLNNSERVLNNDIENKNFKFQRLKNLRVININHNNGFYRNKNEFKVDYKFNEANKIIQKESNYKTDLMLNDKGTLINFDELQNNV